MRASYILITVISLLGCNKRDFGSNGGVPVLTAANIENKEELVVRDVRDRRHDRPTGPDADLYFAARAQENDLSYEAARASYEKLLATYPTSSYVPYTVFALGELHKDGLESDHDRLENALGRYRAILKMSNVDEQLHALVLIRLAQCAEALGDKSTAEWADDEVYKHFKGTRAAELVPTRY
jgi:TolA-binding protein